jgi:hypothetical protein
VSGPLLKGLGDPTDSVVIGGLGVGESAPTVPAAELEVHVSVSVADPYPLPRLSYVVPAATLEAHVSVRVAAKRPRLVYVGAVLPPTDDLGWTTPAVTAPALQGLTVTLGGHPVNRALIEDLTINLSDCGGPISATMVLARDVRLPAQAMLSQLVVTYKGQRLFKGRLEARGLDLGSDMANTLTFTGPIRQLTDHRAFRRVYVDSDLDNWRTDQGPNTQANVFEVTASE